MSPTSILERLLHRLLNLFTEVRRGEAVTAGLFGANLFLILCAYYILKTLREPLILASGGAEVKSYAAALQAVVLVGFLPVYSWFSARVSRMRLIAGVSLFFIGCIEGFYALARWNEASPLGEPAIPHLGVVFYVWVGIFSLSVIAQFWSFANDMFTREAGTRLFPVIAIGATLGSPVGSAVAARLFASGIDPYHLLQVAAALLGVSMVMYAATHRRMRGASGDGLDTSFSATDGLKLVMRSRFLRWIALLLVFANLVNTTGEYILSKEVVRAAELAAAAGTVWTKEAFIGAFYGDFFAVVNVLTFALQALAVSRIVRYMGMRGLILALPVVAFGVYGLVAAGAGFGALRWLKTMENATDYSVMNSAKAMVWLPASRNEKYQGKQAIDTLFVRVGDVLSAALVFVGTDLLGLQAREFALVNLVLIAGWAYVAWRLLRVYAEVRHRSGQRAAS